ncbi:MAG: ATP synthase F0 subunit C [Acidobacteria bacterium]|nr:ATP synthase F0 subunit C [Acidobacteriota bacterium]
MGAGLGAGIVVIGAGFGIGKLTAAATESIARQPQAAKDITAAFQLPLFLLEGVAVIALAVCFVIIFLT